jgi:hypothetical protein
MRARTDRNLLILAVAANGLLAGATLDQAIKQLPARREIGATAYSAYSQAADLSNGVPWYASLGIGGALITIVAVVVAMRRQRCRAVRAALWTAAAATVGHMVVTGFAAPLSFSQRDARDPAEVTDIFNTFEQLNGVRAGLQVVALLAVAVALALASTDSTDRVGAAASPTVGSGQGRR